MLFYTFFKTLMGKEVVVELKNGVAIRGTLHSVDHFLNFKLTETSVEDPVRFPQLTTLKSAFIRGSVVRYVHVPSAEVDTSLLQDAARKEAFEAAAAAAKAAEEAPAA
ncbi:hypothetical protein FNF27_02183 [Cafeteria roenbergensis]|uniref:Sm domain-containing protein n=1 Tax=Cafeteria roenbergensis TaxID=33653 RepID=A0A5A8CT28_CAFRO|nr:hypothetical protein FNF29_01715 [Cafeteria roenbergensis]KAA0166617.1 hypothetical protein FNF31_01395 [Cafeteria roenbergensis]KAA0170340.1 hypothetical protein FNF28_01567 [Cafeteria roenbergensis]KAA0176487.1 hypothetical protein FNF27_02183 [Cafeteria roenbergensis]|eukprot:KAA0155340.1 hypothetical protein FNF29_01715 [Cafeteria roenbergensis]